MSPTDIAQKVVHALQPWLTLVLSIGTFATAIAIPALRFAQPSSFVVLTHVDEIAVPDAAAKLWPSATPVGQTATPGSDDAAAPQSLLLIKALNRASTVRHNVSLRVEGVTQFSGAALGPLDSSNFGMAPWRLPEFRQDESALVFPIAARLSGEAEVQVFVWGRFSRLFGPTVSLESQEGPAYGELEVPVSGWTLSLAENMWWVAMLASFGASLLLLRRFQRRRR
jgi:hypothetical protein